MPTVSRGATTLGSEEIRPPPAGVKYLKFEKSDGNDAIRPTPTNPSGSGPVNYYRQVPLDEKNSTEWRRKIGGKVAAMLGKPSKSVVLLFDKALS